jgi:protein SCO1/2
LGGQTSGGEDEESGQSENSTHIGESKKGLPAIAKAGLGLVALIVVSVMAFAIFEPVQVLPRIRLAPGFSFVDQTNGRLTSDDGRGVVTLYAFVPSNCNEDCDVIHDTMREVGDRVAAEVDMGEAEFRMVTVALDTADPSTLAAAATATGADGEDWRWVGTEPNRLREVVGGGFKVYYDDSDRSHVEFDQKYVIVDGAGLVRGEYSYATLASDADRLTRHVSLLGEEIRNAEGNTALLYEAAHIFLCYP